MPHRQANSESKAVAGAGFTHRRATMHLVELLMVAALILAGCTSASGAYEDALSLVTEESGSGPARDDVTDTGTAPSPYDLPYKELRDGPAAQHLGVARMLDKAGAIELVSRYIINIPNGAYFLPNFELQAAKSASWHSHNSAGDEARVMRDFERAVLHAVDGAALNRLQLAHEPVRLHDAFYAVFEQCGRDSPWPLVKMVERKGTGAGDVLFRDPALDISDYEYKELLHVCGRYAATYPTLDPEFRDELLAPQRAYFAKEVIDRLDNELPVVEIPARYKAEVDDLRANGW